MPSFVVPEPLWMAGMSGHMQIPTRKTNAKWAEECRWRASVCQKEFRDDYLKMAAEYELLSKVEKSGCLAGGDQDRP
jgi:hypothetical protein